MNITGTDLVTYTVNGVFNGIIWLAYARFILKWGPRP